MVRLILLTLFGLFLASAARAATCDIAVETLDFGQVDTLYAEAVDTAGMITVDCSQIASEASTVTVCVHIGAGSGGAAQGRRRMISGGETLAYEIYKNAARSIAWGSDDASSLGTARAVVIPVSGETASATIPFYGRVLPNQSDAASGDYESTFGSGDAFSTQAEGENLDCDAAGGQAKTAFSFAVRAVVPANCLVETSDIAFGQHGLIDRNVDASGLIGVACTPGTAFTVSLNGGLRASDDPERRIMQSGSDQIVYGLYRDQARAQPWGTAPGTLSTGTGAGQTQSLVVYGRVPPQTAAPGRYNDIVGVTITYGLP